MNFLSASSWAEILSSTITALIATFIIYLLARVVGFLRSGKDFTSRASLVVLLLSLSVLGGLYVNFYPPLYAIYVVDTSNSMEQFNYAAKRKKINGGDDMFDVVENVSKNLKSDWRMSGYRIVFFGKDAIDVSGRFKNLEDAMIDLNSASASGPVTNIHGMLKSVKRIISDETGLIDRWIPVREFAVFIISDGDANPHMQGNRDIFTDWQDFTSKSKVCVRFLTPESESFVIAASTDNTNSGYEILSSSNPPEKKYAAPECDFSGSDVLLGSSSADEIEGEGGNDTIDGKGGADRLYGGAGFDEFKFYGEEAIIDGGSSIDRIVLAKNNSNVVIDLRQGRLVDIEEIDLRDGSPSDTLIFDLVNLMYKNKANVFAVRGDTGDILKGFAHHEFEFLGYGTTQSDSEVLKVYKQKNPPMFFMISQGVIVE